MNEMAAINNPEQFTEVYRTMNLVNCNADDLVHIARLALSVGALNIAKETCETGLQRFPDNEELTRMSRIFAPPRITVSRRRLPTGTRANTEWLKAHSAEYRGKWVALENGTLIAAADTVDALIHVTGEVNGTNVFIVPISE